MRGNRRRLVSVIETVGKTPLRRNIQSSSRTKEMVLRCGRVHVDLDYSRWISRFSPRTYVAPYMHLKFEPAVHSCEAVCKLHLPSFLVRYV